MPLILCERNAAEVCILLATLNSFVLDYVLRQKVSGGNLNFYILKQLPIPTPEILNNYELFINVKLLNWITKRILELSYTSWDIITFAKDCGYAGPPFRWDEERRFIIRCELDAAYFHLYQINSNDLNHILDSFPVYRRKDEARYGYYRTKEVIIDIYNRMEKEMNNSTPYQTMLVPQPGPPEVWPPSPGLPWPIHIHPPREE